VFHNNNDVAEIKTTSIFDSFQKLAITSSISLAVLLPGMATADEGIPRLGNGQPDLQGVWSNRTLTPLTRDRELGETLILSEAEARAWESDHAEFIDSEYAPSDPDREAGAGAQGSNDGDTDDGYNEFWKDVGSQLLQINGEYRSSIIVSPASGQIPFAEGARSAMFGNLPEGVSRNDGPEGRPLSERCLISFGTHSGPPMLPVMYNNNYQIVQTDDYVMILAEMIHDARIIRLHGEHRPELDKWMGDSVGHWEGDTLVIETQGFHPQHRIYGANAELSVTERLTRTSEDQILYQFTVEDPTVFSEPWQGELVMNARPDDEPIYEYACHEGNYALPGVLAGARRDEASQ